MRVATTRLARVIARLPVLRAIVRIRAPPARIEILPLDAFTSSDSEEGNQMPGFSASKSSRNICV
jgi:hypothetical protein